MKYSLTIVIVILSAISFVAQSEAHYIDLIASKLNGQKEVKVSNGRVDIVTSTHAIEVEWASNWKHSIGQSLWYALQTNKAPGIILLMKTMDDRKYGTMLSSALSYAGLEAKVRVWYYPEDFGETFPQVSAARTEFKQEQIANSGSFTRNRKSGVRHNSRCTHFSCGNCVPCGPNDGKKACGKCGG